MPALALLLALTLPEPPPVDFGYVGTRPRAVVSGAQAREVGMAAMGQAAAQTVRVEQSHYGIALGSTLSLFQRPRPVSGVCEQTVFELYARRTADTPDGLTAEQRLEREASGQGYALEGLEIRHQYSRPDANGDCSQASVWTRARDSSAYIFVMSVLDRLKEKRPRDVRIARSCLSAHGVACPADSRDRIDEFLQKPVVVVQRVGDVATAESHGERLVIWSAPVRGSFEIGIEAIRIQDNPPPPLS